MKLITDKYKKLNTHYHKIKKGRKYGTSAPRFDWLIDDFIRKYKVSTVIDYGCGKGLLKREWSDLEVIEYDPGIPGKTMIPSPSDHLISIDVLEHIEPELIRNVLQHIKTLTKDVALLSISCVPSGNCLPDGRNAHLIVEPMEWWLWLLEDYFMIEKSGPTKKESFYVYARPKIC